MVGYPQWGPVRADSVLLGALARKEPTMHKLVADRQPEQLGCWCPCGLLHGYGTAVAIAPRVG